MLGAELLLALHEFPEEIFFLLRARGRVIRQYALWTKIEGWGEDKFGEVFVEKTKQNALPNKIKWTKQIEQAVRGLVPERWRDISMVLDEAQKLPQQSPRAGAQ